MRIDDEQQSGAYAPVDEWDADAGRHLHVGVGVNDDCFVGGAGALACLPVADVLGNFSVEQRAHPRVVGAAVLGAVGDQAAGEIVEGHASSQDDGDLVDGGLDLAFAHGAIIRSQFSSGDRLNMLIGIRRCSITALRRRSIAPTDR